MPDLLNDACHCISLDEDALRAHFDAALLCEGSLPELSIGREHLFAPCPVFANHHQLAAMRALIHAAHEVMALPGFRRDALAHRDRDRGESLAGAVTVARIRQRI